MPEASSYDEHQETSEAARLPEIIELSDDGFQSNRYVDFEAGIQRICSEIGWSPERAIQQVVTIEHQDDDGQLVPTGTYTSGNFSFRKVSWIKKQQ